MADEGMRIEDKEAAFDWALAIRQDRRRKRLSRPEIARRSGLSLSAVKAYETGARHPSREALTAIIDALGMTSAQGNPVLAGAGYATNWRAIFHEAYGPRDLSWFTEQVELVTWPVFVTNEASDIVAANRVFRALIGIPPAEALPRPDKWNFIAMATHPWWADRVDNWDEAMSWALGLAKTGLRRQINLERPAPWSIESYAQLLKGDPGYIARMLKLWEPAEPVEHTTRMRYPARWRHDTGEVLRFSAIVHVADVWEVYAWHDWIPEDPETLRVVSGLT
jgi:transcriptional regulator with XRE-family HTH domain